MWRPALTEVGFADGFVHVADGELVDGAGNALRLRGVGLGNWLLPEGYMWHFEPGGPLSPRQIEALIVDLIGVPQATQFWRQFRARFITEADIERIAATGMNHVRLPVNSRVVQTDAGELIEDGFALIDQLIAWCKKHRLWVVLDLHGAPGGQTGTNIDDSPHALPELFTDAGNAQRCVELWQAIATRYRDETAVAGYDLLNEPLPNEYQTMYAAELVELYARLTQAIREIDHVHAIIYEGTHWSTNWDIFNEVWDPNSILQCHKYWSPPDRQSVQRYVDRGRELGLPVYMGETGENNLDWLQAAFRLYDDCGMSWNLWPWKKLDTVTSPCSVNPPAGWQEIVDYARGEGVKPEPERAWQILAEFLDAIELSACTYRAEVVNAVMQRAPLRIPAWGFGFLGAGVSYKTSAGMPLAGFRSDDRVSLSCTNLDSAGAPTFHHNHGAPRSEEDQISVCLSPGDWVAYEFEASSASDVVIEVALDRDVATPPIDVMLDGERLALVATGGGVRSTVGTVAAGWHSLRVCAGVAAVGLRWVEIFESAK